MATYSSILAKEIPWTEEPGMSQIQLSNWACTHIQNDHCFKVSSIEEEPFLKDKSFFFSLLNVTCIQYITSLYNFHKIWSLGFAYCYNYLIISYTCNILGIIFHVFLSQVWTESCSQWQILRKESKYPIKQKSAFLSVKRRGQNRWTEQKSE